jgi:hypothetical protein
MLSWAGQKLLELKNARQANPDVQTLALYASEVCKFSKQAIENACAELGRNAPNPFAPQFPSLGDVIATCRRMEEDLRAAKDTEWTLERYRWAWYFDKFLAEQLEDGKSREEVLRKFPEMGPMWSRWKNQQLAGTLQVPKGWCENCEGTGWIPTKLPSSNSAMRSCRCRTRTA